MESGSVNCWREVTQEGGQGCGEFPCILPPASVSLLMMSPSIAGVSCRVERLEMRQQLHKRPKSKMKPLGSCAYSTCCAPCDSSQSPPLPLRKGMLNKPVPSSHT